MGIIAKQSTARIITVGPVLDATGVAVTDGVVADFKVSKNGGAPAALNGSATLTHRHTGHYSLSLTATDLDTVGSAEITIDDTVNSCGIKEITVVEEAVYDSLFLAGAGGYQVPIWSSASATVSLTNTTVATVTTTGTVNALGTNAITATAIQDNAITANKIASNAITDAKINTGAFTAAKFAAGAFDAVWTVATRTMTAISDSAGITTLLSRIIGTLASGTHNPQTGDSFARLGAAGAGLTAIGDTRMANLDAAVSSRLATAGYTVPPTTGQILTALGTGTWLTAIPWNAAWDTEVQSEVQDAIELNHLDHLLAVDYDPASKPGVATALLNELVENDGGVARYTANALEQAASGPGGGEDWTLAERAQIRYRLAMDGDAVEPTGPTTIPAVVVPSPDPLIAVGHTTTRNGQGTLSPLTAVFFELASSASGDGNFLRSDKITLTSDAQSLLQGNFLRGATYRAWRRRPRNKISFVVPNESSFELPEIVD